MANKPMKPLSVSTNQIKWADPTRLSTTFVANVKRSLVNVGQQRLNHVSVQYLSMQQRSAPVPAECKDACLLPTETQSIRTVIAGSAENLVSLKAAWEVHKANVDAMFINADAGLGFLDPTAAIQSTETESTGA